MHRMGTEAAFRVFARARSLERQGRDIVHLEMGEPDMPTPAFIRKAGAEAIEGGYTGYAPAAGIVELREAIARHMLETRNYNVSPDQVVVMPGGKPVIFATFLVLVQPGDEVIYPDPGFPIFESMTRALGGIERPWFPGAGTNNRPDLDALGALMGAKTKLLVLNSPSNPTGIVYRPEELARIAELAIRHDVVVLSDEIYSHILFDGVSHTSIATLPEMAARTVLLDGFSKTWSMTGWRLGYAVAPPWLVGPLVKINTNTTSCAVHFAQRAAVAALEGPRDAVDAMVRAFEQRRDTLVAGLNGLPGMRCDPPQGSFFAFADVRATGRPAPELAAAFLEEGGVACVEGEAFGQFGGGAIRFALAASEARIEEACARMARVLGA